MQLSECDRVYRTMWKRPHSRNLLVILFIAGALGIYVFLHPELTTPAGMTPDASSYMPLLFFIGWLILLAIFPVWWLVTENYGRVGITDDGLLVSQQGSEDVFVRWNQITELRWSTLGITEPVAHSHIMQVIIGEEDAVEVGFAHKRDPHRDMIDLRELIIQRLNLEEMQVRPAAWFEEGRLQIAGMEHLRRWRHSDATPQQ